MKKLYSESKYREQTIRRRRKQLRRLQSTSVPRRVLTRKTSHRHHIVTLKAPENFSMVNNAEAMIGFFSDIQFHTHRGRRVSIDLSEIRALTSDGLLTLLAKANDPKFSLRMSIQSNRPNDPKLRTRFEQSGILQHVKKSTYQVRQEAGDADLGTIVRKKSYVVESTTAKDLITFATEHLYGTRQRRKGIARTLIECMNNTINHAAPRGNKDETWWATVYCDPEERKAFFSFLDTGVGIFESIKVRNIKKQLAQLFGRRNNADLLQEILRGEIGSRTGLHYRGNGLPRIFEVVKRKQLTNLILITNDVYANVSRGEYRTLPKSFGGTFYHWEMTNGENS